MPPFPKGFLDGFTRVDELLIENTKQIAKLVQLMQGEEDRDLKIVFYTYPSDGTYISLSAGTLVLDFGVGTIDTNGTITAMNHSLQSDYKDFLRSIFVDANKDIIVQLGTQDKIPVKEGKQLLATYQQFTKVTITTTVPTNVFVLCCTNPEAIIQFVNYAMVLKDPNDVFGNPTFIGNAELATRLGSIKTFEKRGEVVFMDDFEASTFHWIASTTGSGGSINRSNYTSRSKNYSLKLIPGTANLNRASIRYRHFLLIAKRIGVEWSFALGDEIDINIEIDHYSNTTQYHSVLGFRHDEDDLYIHPEQGFTTLKANIDLYQSDFLFHTAKLVVDLDTNKYVRFLIDDEEFDLSAYDLVVTTGSYTRRMELILSLGNTANGTHHCYFDDIIITQNEP